MNPFTIDNPDQDKVVITKEVQERKQQKQGTIKRHKGHTLFELNLKTKEIKKAVFESVDYVVGEKNSTRLKVIENKNCIYISALNENNALKKFFKSINKNDTRTRANIS